MNKFKQRDEVLKARLSSFLRKEGELTVQRITPIKNHVFYIESALGKALILKSYRKLKVIEQQWHFFEQLQASFVIPFIKYPNGKKTITDGNYFWTIAPFVRGRQLDYQHKKDRITAIKTLHAFHKKANHIYFPNQIKKDLFILRWKHRLAAFKKTEHVFQKNGFEMLYKDMVTTMHYYLKTAENLSWDKNEKDANIHGKWIHGDVASHNFIQNEQTYMIDFDLLSCGTQLYDYIQLGQRFLPYINWDLNELCSYQMVKDKNQKKWLTSIMIPSDMIREWMFFLSYGSSFARKQYLSQMEKTWGKRQFFLKNAKSMLKSL
ncbi:phosphotransferase [Virgibacillus alimentarius]|uniref:Aminoglycoside phosphotransferase domain-containing protein n=1 Tax=Virgibacillus alimentarius TaxID=698769 RepID=A0ABS4S556_9BACI|nr:phosphotransferase [Virgibacillus alimentarius]MBP2256626.1 hypothetical protein [Virgibacillus alimentarius]